MLYLLIFVLILLGFWGLLLYVRKSQWDTIHRNLLDLEDNYDGKVIRRGFAARPFFYGKIHGYPITVNISSEKLGKERLNYFDISWGIPVQDSFTLAEYQWLKKHRDDQAENMHLMENVYGTQFAVIHKDEKKIQALSQHPMVQKFIDECNELCYVFLGKTGMICEFRADNLAEASKYENMNKRLELLKNLGEAFKK